MGTDFTRNANFRPIGVDLRGRVDHVATRPAPDLAFVHSLEFPLPTADFDAHNHTPSRKCRIRPNAKHDNTRLAQDTRIASEFPHTFIGKIEEFKCMDESAGYQMNNLTLPDIAGESGRTEGQEMKNARGEAGGEGAGV